MTLHYDNGFTLTSATMDDNSKKAPVLWHFPYEKLRMSADDGMRLLWLDFGEDGEQVRITAILDFFGKMKTFMKVHPYGCASGLILP